MLWLDVAEDPMTLKEAQMRSLRYLPLAAVLSALLLLGGPLHAAQNDKTANTPSNPSAATPAADAKAPSGQKKGGKASYRPGNSQGGGQDRRLERLQQQLGSSAEEWLVIKPLLAEVIKAQSSDSPFRSSQKMGGRKKGGGKAQAPTPVAAPADATPAKPSPRQTLSKLLADGNTPAPELKAQMEALRAEQKQKAEALRAAREKLRPLLTVKQEATLLLQGYMD